MGRSNEAAVVANVPSIGSANANKGEEGDGARTAFDDDTGAKAADWLVEERRRTDRAAAVFMVAFCSTSGRVLCGRFAFAC